MADPSTLPIHALRASFDAADPRGRLVISSPTGSGKSTEIPRWCAGRVLVVEPRRVACRTLAQRMAELEGTSLGGAVGYRVRDEARVSEDTRIVLATPGIVLRAKDELPRYQTVILDEFHERGLETDLLLALMLRHFPGRLIVMSATLQEERVAAHLGGGVLRAEGRTHPVAVHHLGGSTLLPDESGLTRRVLAAVEAAERDPGDMLVFLPGKAEIGECARALEGRDDLEVLQLHGELSLDQQRRVFGPARKRKVILSTNVAETSVTVPGVGVVIDGGLVRQTRYLNGRGHLALVPIAMDSANQRAGRAGRTGPGVVYRLWSPAAKLADSTPPEIFRESLVPLVLGAAAWGADLETLPLLDRPRDAAVAAARTHLRTLGALDADNKLTPGGEALYGLPLDPWLGTLLLKARELDCLPDAVDLAAVLSVGRPLFARGGPDPQPADEADVLRAEGCDATAAIRALRLGQPGVHGLNPQVLEEARRVSTRLRRLQRLPERTPGEPVQRRRLALAALAADPQSAFVARKRSGRRVWNCGGSEVELARDSAVNRLEGVEAIIVMASRAVSQGFGDNQVITTCAMPVPLPWLSEAGVGTARLERISVEDGKVVAHIERVYAEKVLSVREEVPQGALAREAIVALFLRGSLFKGVLAVTRERLERMALWSQLTAAGIPLELYTGDVPPPHVPPLETWVRERVTALGVESGDDLSLLSRDDFTAPDLPEAVRTALDKHFPSSVRVGQTTFDADYAPALGQVVLRLPRGGKVEPPQASFFPQFGGLRVVLEMGGVQKVIRHRK